MVNLLEPGEGNICNTQLFTSIYDHMYSWETWETAELVFLKSVFLNHSI